MVRMRASDFFSCRIFLIASTSPSANLKFSRNRDSFRRAASACRSSSVMPLNLSTSSRLFMVRCACGFKFQVPSLKLSQPEPGTWNLKLSSDRAPFLVGAGNEFRLNRQFLRGQLHRLARRLLVHTFDLVKNAARLNHRDPVFGCALA